MLEIDLVLIERIVVELEKMAEHIKKYSLELRCIKAEISRLSCTEEIAGRLSVVEEKFLCLNQSLKQMIDSLNSIVEIVAYTEKDLEETYQGEKVIFKQAGIGRYQIAINDNLERIARITLK